MYGKLGFCWNTPRSMVIKNQILHFIEFYEQNLSNCTSNLQHNWKHHLCYWICLWKAVFLNDSHLWENAFITILAYQISQIKHI